MCGLFTMWCDNILLIRCIQIWYCSDLTSLGNVQRRRAALSPHPEPRKAHIRRAPPGKYRCLPIPLPLPLPPAFLSFFFLFFFFFFFFFFFYYYYFFFFFFFFFFFVFSSSSNSTNTFFPPSFAILFPRTFKNILLYFLFTNRVISGLILTVSDINLDADATLQLQLPATAVLFYSVLL